jgi:hypothetical protein
VFISVVKVDGQIVGRGRGTTKKASQQVAAAEALARLKPGTVLEPAAADADSAGAATDSTKDGE